MKKIIALILSLAILATPALALKPEATPSLICLDRKYNFLDPDNYVAISASSEHVALIDDMGGLWTFGSNQHGQLGIGDARNAYNAPIKVLEGVKKVKAKTDSTLAIKKDGSVWAFGKGKGATPSKVLDNVKDADLDGYLAYIDNGGSAYFRDFESRDVKLCDNAREIHVFYNYTDGNGFSAASSGGAYKPPSSAAYGPQSFPLGGLDHYLDKKTAYILVYKNDNSIWEYPVNMQSAAGKASCIAQDVKGLTVHNSSVSLSFGNGSFSVGSYASGLSQITRPNCIEYSFSDFNKTADGSVWYKQKKCVGKNVKFFVPVANDRGVFMIHEDNSASTFGVTDSLEEMFNTVNAGMTTINPQTRYDDIYAKTMELKGGCNDDYTNAKAVSRFIQKHVKYEFSAHDQSGVQAFRKGSGVCAAYADLTRIMFSYLNIPVHYFTGENHAWNTAIIDGVCVFIDNTNGVFDAGLFSLSFDSHAYNNSRYDNWAASEVRGAYDYDIIDRLLGADFRQAITRLNFCALARATIEKALGKDINSVIADKGKSGVAVPFTDSTDPDVIAMYKLGIVGGTSATTFHPGRTITRQEAAKIITGLAKTLGADVTAPASSFADSAKISAWAKPYVDFVNSAGIMKGKTSGFDPLNTISVQESILIHYRYLGNVIG